MRRLLGLGFIAFLVALAIVIGQRMSTDAMAVVIGVVFGVIASIPTSLLIIAATRRSAAERSSGERSYPERYVPPVIVVSPGAQQSSWLPPTSNPPPLPPPSGRQFRIVGGDGWSEAWDDTVEAGDWRAE